LLNRNCAPKFRDSGSRPRAADKMDPRRIPD
jgi:hypothetical protein